MDVVGDVDERGDVDSELAEDGRDDVPVPDVVLRSLFGELFDRLRESVRAQVRKEDIIPWHGKCSRSTRS